MTDRVVPLHANVHRMVDALLPWYVNGTLKSGELELVTRHLGECAQCRREVDWLRELHAACAECAARDGGSQLFDALRQRSAPARRPDRVWRVAAAAAFLVVALLGWRLWVVDGPDASYRTLGAPGTVASGNVVVVFDAATTEADMRRLLQSIGARIVEGPTATNGYVLAIPASAQAHAIEALRATPIVKLAESLRGSGSP